MQKDQIDQGLSFKKRARRRLVGAIALVLLMVIILPMLLEDREQGVQQEDVEIVMPDDSMQLSEPDVTLGLGAEESVIKTAGAPTATEVVALPKVKVQTEKPEQPEAKQVAKVEPKKAEVKPQVKKAAVKKSTQPKKATASNKYYVQIGVFSDPSNIKKLQAKLDGLGYKSLTEKLTSETGVKTRLRTESFIGRNEASIALENIKDAGLAGMVVNQK